MPSPVIPSKKKTYYCYATISSKDNNCKKGLYKGSFEASFKKRYGNQKKPFKLSTEYWNLKKKQLNPETS